MSDYKRFISYVYEYRGGQKRENRGFVKVEARNGQCQMNFVLKGLCQDGSGTCQLYAFRRNGELLEGSLLYTGKVQDGMMNCRLQAPCAELGDDAFSLEETAGLIMVCNQTMIYATQWDDDPLNFQGFPNKAQNDMPPSDEAKEGTESDTPAGNTGENTVLPENRTDEAVNMNPEIPANQLNNDFSENQTAGIETPPPESQVNKIDNIPERQAGEDNSRIPEQQIDGDNNNRIPEQQADGDNNVFPAQQPVENNTRIPEQQADGDSNSISRDLTDADNNGLPEAKTDELINKRLSDENIPPEYPSRSQADVQATSASAAARNYFRDGSIINCVKITLQDIQKLDIKDWHLKNNQFVHYGYQAFGHLLVGQLADTGQTVLCVPGSYHQRECFMANMYCFPHFKQCPGRTDSRRCFGYWYRSIHPANLDPGNSCS